MTDVPRTAINNTNVANVGKKMEYILKLRLCDIWTTSIVFLMSIKLLKCENLPLYSSLCSYFYIVAAMLVGKRVP